ncbi:MAG: FeoB-associated Cys-rich membrane protein [Prevotellaceae bacterium]|nr:FeoB-associated Cys-rich membrane protein [Prevotellaceae bacterium]
MNAISIIILAIVLLAVIAALRYHFRTGRKKGCGGACSGCQLDCDKRRRL